MIARKTEQPKRRTLLLEIQKISASSHCLHLRSACLPTFNIAQNKQFKMARSTGFEPVTVRLEGGCSIQLSYER